MVNTHTSYSGGLGFKPRPGDRVSWLRLSRFSSLRPYKCWDSTEEVVHDRFPKHVLSILSFTYYPLIQRYTEQVTEKASLNKLKTNRKCLKSFDASYCMNSPVVIRCSTVSGAFRCSKCATWHRQMWLLHYTSTNTDVTTCVNCSEQFIIYINQVNSNYLFSWTSNRKVNLFENFIKRHIAPVPKIVKRIRLQLTKNIGYNYLNCSSLFRTDLLCR